MQRKAYTVILHPSRSEKTFVGRHFGSDEMLSFVLQENKEMVD